MQASQAQARGPLAACCSSNKPVCARTYPTKPHPQRCMSRGPCASHHRQCPEPHPRLQSGPRQSSQAATATAYSLPVPSISVSRTQRRITVPVLQGLRVEVEVSASASWMASPSLDRLLGPLLTAPSMKLPSSLLLTTFATATQRCASAFGAVKVHPTADRQSRHGAVWVAPWMTPGCGFRSTGVWLMSCALPSLPLGMVVSSVTAPKALQGAFGQAWACKIPGSAREWHHWADVFPYQRISAVAQRHLHDACGPALAELCIQQLLIAGCHQRAWHLA